MKAGMMAADPPSRLVQAQHRPGAVVSSTAFLAPMRAPSTASIIAPQASANPPPSRRGGNRHACCSGLSDKSMGTVALLSTRVGARLAYRLR